MVSEMKFFTNFWKFVYENSTHFTLKNALHWVIEMLKSRSFRGRCPLDTRRAAAPGPRQGPWGGPLDPRPLVFRFFFKAPFSCLNIPKEIFGEQLRVKLDLFHAIGRFSCAFPKRTSLRNQIMKEFGLVFCAAGDIRKIRGKRHHALN